MLAGTEGTPVTDQVVLDFLRKIARKGGKARAEKYSKKTLRKWAKQSGAGQPHNETKEEK